MSAPSARRGRDDGQPSLRVWTADATSVQLVWSAMPDRDVTVSVGDISVRLDVADPAWLYPPWRSARPLSDLPGGPGAVVVDGLEPATSYPVGVRIGAGPARRVGTATTLAPPPGALLSRFATVSDLHVGEKRFGAFGGVLDVHPRRWAVDPYAVRAAVAALDEAREWGAEQVVLKGDLTARTRVHEFETVARIVADAGIPAVAQLGNHDAKTPALGAALLTGMAVAHDGGIVVVDLPGVRLVVGDSAVRGERQGRLGARQIAAITEAVADAGTGAVVSLHHPPRRLPVATAYPPGVEFADSRALLVALGRLRYPAVVLAGHTHRNRSYRSGQLRIAEVGSTKDYPGGWGAYSVYEGGIVQSVRRTARHDVIAWTEATGRTLGGLWGRWSPGRLPDRCWTHTWA